MKNIYIGQTIFPIEERFYRHIRSAINKTQEYKFQKAILAIGPEHFKINLVEDVEDNLLDEREIYWIAFYDSYRNGYNSTVGGSGRRRIDGRIEDEIIKLRKQGMYIRDIAEELKVCTKTVYLILRYNGLGIRLVKDEEICKLKEQGLKTTEVCRRLNCSPQTVERALYRNNKEEFLQKNYREVWHKKAVEMRKEGYTLNQIAAECNINRGTIAKYLKQVMPEQVRCSPGSYDEEVQRLLLQNKTDGEIRKIVGCSENVIRRNKSLLFDV